MTTKLFVDGEMMREFDDYTDAIIMLGEYEKAVNEDGVFITKSRQTDNNSGFEYTEYKINWNDTTPSYIVLMVDGYYL